MTPPPVHVHFFVNNFDVTKNDDGSIASIGVQHSAGDDDRLTGFLDASANLEPRSKTGTGMLWATDVDVWRKDRSKSVLDDVPSSEPIFRHISNADLDQIRKEGDKALSEDEKPFGDPTLSEGDWTIYGLLTCWNFTVYRTWFYTEEGMKVYNFFTSHMRQLFFEVARNGNFPFYKRQANAMKSNIHSSDFRVEDCMPPLPLVKSWRLTSQNQKPVSATPESWNMFRTLEVYPDARTKAFAMRLGIARNRANGIAEIQDCINKHNGNIEAEIWPLSIKSSYFVQMSLGEQQGKIFTDEAVPVPAVNTRLSIEITDGQFEGRRFEGVVVEDAYGLGMDLCASVYLKKGQQELPKAVTIVNVSIKLTDDGTPCDRQNAAMIQLAGGTHREEGVDLTSVLLEAPRTIEKVSSLADEVKNSDKAKDEFRRTLASYGLNQNQRSAADYSFTSESGLTVVWGPPGTGKTYVAMAALHAHVNVGGLAGINKRPVMVCAPSHAAVDKNLGTLLKAVARSETPLKICRFRGGTYSGYMSKVRTDNEANKQALADLKKASDSADPDDDVPALAVWEAIDNASRSNQMLGGGMHPEYEFNRQRKDFIEGIAGNKTSPWCKDARDYFFLKRQLRDATPDHKKEILSDLEVWEETWNKRYFSTVDVVFCTNIGSAHPVLTSFYQPRILIIDEYAQESLPNSSTPAAAHMKSLELFWATGDPEQQGPVPSTKGSNECFWDVSKSPFEMLFGDLSVRERVQLVVQHRMRPDISAMVSRIWYKDALEDGQAVQTESLLEKTIKQAFAGLGDFWNGRTRFMVDVSGPGVASTPYNNDKSLYNRAEADLIVEIVKYLLAFEPKLELGQPILPKIKHNDIMIVTGYNGQVQYIKKQLLAKEVNTVGTREVRAVEVPVLTTGAVQGGEAPIVLHSMVRNAPGNPTAMGFTRKSNQLCVNFSRAQIHHITVGNVRALMQSKIHGSGVFEKGGKLHRLGLILDDFYREKDMLSGEHMAALIEGREVKLDDSIFGKFAPPMNRTGLNLPRGRGRGRGRGGDRGRGRGRGDPRPYVRIPGPVDDAGSALADTLFTLSVKESKQRRDAERDRKRPAAHEEADPRQPYEPPAKRPNTAAEAGDKMDEDLPAGPAGGQLEEGEVPEAAGQ